MNELEVQKPRMMMIKNLCPGLAEVGKIKIGNKGKVRSSQGGKDWQPPQKLDHFLITTMERGADGNFIVDERLQKKFGDPPRSIPVRLIYDDIGLNFATRYICYYGKTVFCSGDGETATRLQKDGTFKMIPCTCGRQDPKYAGDDGPNGADNVGGKNGKGKCKINGILSALIDGAEMVGGVWKFRTTSYNSVVGILSSLALIARITGGRLAGIPLNMTVTPKTVQDPIQGNQQTIYVVGLQFAGTMDTLRSTGYQIAMDEAKHGISMAQIETQAMMMLSHTPAAGLGNDLDEDVIEEFYPEEAISVMKGATVIPDVQVTDEAARARLDMTQDLPETATIPARKRGEPSPGNKRRTKLEMEEDKAAEEAERVAAEQAAGDGAKAGCDHPEESQYQEGEAVLCGVCGDTIAQPETLPNLDGPEDGFPENTGSQEQRPAAVQEQKKYAPIVGDLF
jgi:hypothetical protein